MPHSGRGLSLHAGATPFLASSGVGAPERFTMSGGRICFIGDLVGGKKEREVARRPGARAQKILVAAPGRIPEARRIVMKLNPMILSLVVGIVLGILVGSWSNQRFGRDDMPEYVHGQW